MSTHLECANALRILSIDAIEKSKSGHPGMPMGMADIAEVLWRKYLVHNPKNPDWGNRDRFVLSNGHGSMLLYSLLHLSGYDLSIADLKNFRTLHAKTPGHPEYGITTGVETTTGPLGQGLATAMGMALAEKILAATFNFPGYTIIDHYTYVFAGDGCLMEGISHETCSLAGTLGLGKLIVFYDSNKISIDGQTDNWFSEDTASRYEAYGWQVISIDGHDHQAISDSICSARSESTRPTLIICNTVIGKGSPNKSGSEKIHGAALGPDEVAATRKAINWDSPPFEIPDHIAAAWDSTTTGQNLENDWLQLMESYQQEFPDLAFELKRRLSKELPIELPNQIKQHMMGLTETQPNIATRKASLNTLNAIAPHIPELIGGSADLSESNCTQWQQSTSISANSFSGNYIHYGVREFAMTAIINGLTLHGGFIPFGGTFLVFSDYARSALRSAALMEIQSIFVYTHDSICLGSDGPTHQPVEHLASLRIIPNVDTWRPCDSDETAIAWHQALLRHDGPTTLALSRQNLPYIKKTEKQISDIQKGAYVIWGIEKFEILIIATGSEVSLAIEVAQALYENHNVTSRVVSMPCMDVFLRQSQQYQNTIIPKSSKKSSFLSVAIEAASSSSWHRWVDPTDGVIVGIDSFGDSGSIDELVDLFGFTSSKIIERILLKWNNHLINTDIDHEKIAY